MLLFISRDFKKVLYPVAAYVDRRRRKKVHSSTFLPMSMVVGFRINTVEFVPPMVEYGFESTWLSINSRSKYKRL